MRQRSRSREILETTFWDKIQKPFFVMAPMANVTDSVFRKLFAKYGKPDVTWTEFVSADGLLSRGKDMLLIDLQYSKKERPIVAQLFTGNGDVMRKATKLVASLGFDGIDINMGCPDRAVEKQGGGASLIKDKKKALEVIVGAKQGVSEYYNEQKRSGKKAKIIPISIKTRIGYNKIDYDWLKFILEQKPPALTIHLRTRKEMSDVSAHWEIMPDIIKMRDEISPKTLIIGNGDVDSLGDAKQKIKESNCDGIMIGRGLFGKPWFFDSARNDVTVEDRLKIMLEHTKLFDKTYKNVKNFAIMRKHFKAYVSGWDGAKDLRVKLMETTNSKEVKKIVDSYLKHF